MEITRPGRRTTTVGLLVSVLALCVSGLTACSGEGAEPAPAPTLVVAPSTRAVLDRTLQGLSTATSVRLRVASTHVPASAGTTRLLTGDGVATFTSSTSGAFAGTTDLLINNRRTSLKLVSYRGTVYMKPEGATRYQVVDPVSFGLFDPAVLVRAKNGIGSLISGLKSVQDQGVSEVDGVRVHTLEGQVTGLLAHRLLPIADVYQPVGIDLQIDEKTSRLRRVDLNAYFFSRDEQSTYRITLSRWNEKVTITNPTT
ncbi:LppX_LprAFG lipoprotein [Spongisporangium articulatum]|uniref:LppX_LprAFG lipoprotein n=1 Tax=Spongisporangium articulatum TaxID=3362603 RepID=A0ABW8ALL9_9ACTN